MRIELSICLFEHKRALRINALNNINADGCTDELSPNL